MPPTVPFWFKQRQCKAEPAGSDNSVKISGPNLADAYLGIAPAEAGQWTAALRVAADGPAVSTAEGLPSAAAAWDAAFELFRESVIN
jgi:hypothetical protein